MAMQLQQIEDPRAVDAREMEAAILEFGYECPKHLPDGRVAALCRFMYTTAIITMTPSGYHVGYEDRWCYHDYRGALRALEQWDGAGEPTGWHRHPDTGRRVDADGNRYVQP